MSDITLDSVKSIISKTLDQFQEAVLLLKAVHDGAASQQEVAGFLTRLGVISEAESEAVRQNDDAMLVGTALAFLNANTPPTGVLEREWASAARTHLAFVLTFMPINYFRTIVEDRQNEMWLVSQTVKEWQVWASDGPGRKGPEHKDRPVITNIVMALLAELRK